MTKAETTKGIKNPPLKRVLSGIRKLIDSSRRYMADTANLVLVNLYWNIGRIISEDIQKSEKRAEYGKKLIQELSVVLSQEYGKGFSRVNLQDMRRFFESFKICQAPPDKSGIRGKSQAVPDKLGLGPILF